MKSLALLGCVCMLVGGLLAAQDDVHPIEIKGNVVPPRLTGKYDLKLSKADKKVLRQLPSCDVFIGVTVTQAGSVRDEHVTQSCNPLVDERALAMVSSYRFIQAQLEGSAVAVTLKINVHVKIY